METLAGATPPRPTRLGAPSPGVRGYLLAVLSVFTAIPLLWLGHAYATRTADTDRRAHDQALVNLAQSVARQLSTMLEARCRDLEVLAGGIEVLGELEGPRVQALLTRHWERSNYYTGSQISDATGNPLVRAPASRPDGSAGMRADQRDRHYYQELARTRRTSISRVQRGSSPHATSIQIATPIFDRNRALVGFVEGSVALDQFAELVRSPAALVAGSRVVVLDGASSVVADSTPRTQARAGYRTSAPVYGLAPGEPLGSSARDEHGDLVRAAVEPGGALLPEWRVVASRSQQSVDENARRTRNEAWANAGALWLLVFLLATVVAGHFGRRLAELADTVSAIGEGDFARRAAPARRWEPREFAVLIKQIGAMAKRLSRHTRELETVVHDRTAKLAEVNDRLTFLVNALERADDGIEITGPDAHFIYVNPAFQKITGYHASELLGRTPALLRSSAHDTAFYEAIWQRVSSGQVYSGSLVGRRKDGSLFDQELTIWPIVDQSGKIQHYVGLRRDVTERRRTERALRVSERMASVGTLAAGVAHEINNPLTYVLLNLTYLREQLAHASLGTKAQPERVQLALDRALEGAERVSSIVKDLRTLSRPDDCTIHVVDPRALLDSALRMVGNDIRHRARLVEDFRPIPRVMANEARLSQVFLNLLVNAVQALDGITTRPAEITVVTATDERGFAVVEVGDTGCGIPAEHLHRIFDPFFTTKPVGLGTGLGLAVCHSTVKAMEGEIQVQSVVGTGSRFRVVLPPAASVGREPSPEPTRASVHRTLTSQRVLVMDDDLAVGEALRQALSEHDVTVVGSARAGLEAVERGAFSAIFCDVMMPVMTGIQFYEELSLRDRSLLDRVVFMTGGVLTDAARAFLAERAVPCLEKPVSLDQLEAALGQLSGQRTAEASSTGPAA
jgi:PAS domain S-box-containing protein